MKEYFYSLDALRGIAASLIVLLHFGTWEGWENASSRSIWSIAVPFFFILSGFVLTNSIRYNNSINIKEFFVKRFARLYPVHFFTFVCFPFFVFVNDWIIYKVYCVFKGVCEKYIRYEEYLDFYALFDQIFMIQGMGFKQVGWVQPSWTLSIELWGSVFCFLLLAKFEFKYLLIKLFIVLILTPIIFMDGSILFSGKENLYDTVFMNKGFIVGVYFFLLGSLIYNIRIIYKGYKLILSSLVEFFLLLMVFFALYSDFYLKEAIGCLLLSFVVFFYSFESGVITRFLKLNIFLYIGKLSFSMYMTHWIVLVYWPLIESVIILISKPLYNLFLVYWVDKVFYFIIVVTFSHFVWYFIERPCQRFIVKTSQQRMNAGLQS